MADLSLGDAMALTRDKDGFLEGNGIIILILFFLIFGFGGNGFGGNSNALTQAELQTGLYNQTTDRNLSEIRTAQCATDNLINTNAMAINNAIAESKYENLIQFKDMMANSDKCCCSIKEEIRNDGEKTRALITANYQASLLEKINDLKAQVSNNEQTGYLLNTMGRWVGYNGCGNSCGCGCGSNLI